VRVQVKNLDAKGGEVAVFRDGRTDAEWYALKIELGAGDARLEDDGGRVVARALGGTDAEESPDAQRFEVRLRFSREEGGGEPVRWVWEFPVETRELRVPFEFRDLPIP
jgi:hypothetical protein